MNYLGFKMSNTKTTKANATRATVYLMINGKWQIERENCPVATAYHVRQDLLDSGHWPHNVRIVNALHTPDWA